MKHEHGDELEQILEENWLTVPDDFLACVMAQLKHIEPVDVSEPAADINWQTRIGRCLTWLSLATGAVVGVAEVTAFVLGAWRTASAL